MSDTLELGSADFITIGTIGAPGARVFHIQAGQKDTLLTFTIEKEQAGAVSASIKNILDELEAEENIATPDVNLADLDVELREPVLPVFRIAQIGLGYDEVADQVTLILGELLPEDAPQEPRVARITASRSQMRALSQQARVVVVSGRPTAQSNGKPRVI